MRLIITKKKVHKQSYRLFLFCLFIVCPLFTVSAEPPTLNFRSDGTFRILQFTDTHYQTTRAGRKGALDIFTHAIPLVKPDFIILTGDIVTSEHDSRELWLDILKILEDAKIPWAVVFGNHDDQWDIKKPEMMELFASCRYNMTKAGPDSIFGVSNFILEIGSSKPPHTTEALLYCLDCNANQTSGILVSQVEWYRRMSKAYTARNGGKPYPALAFTHIPTPEIAEIIAKPTTVGLYGEPTCHYGINSGLYANFIDCGDVMGAFFGHDHSNNYIGCLNGICLAYGYCGGKQSSDTKTGRGVRVIELIEGQRSFNTWLLKLFDCNRFIGLWKPYKDAKPIFFVKYPKSFL